MNRTFPMAECYRCMFLKAELCKDGIYYHCFNPNGSSEGIKCDAWVSKIKGITAIPYEPIQMEVEKK
jgi:hypothetical protein